MNNDELKHVSELIESKESEQLKEYLSGLHPADIAELCNELDAEEVLSCVDTGFAFRLAPMLEAILPRLPLYEAVL